MPLPSEMLTQIFAYLMLINGLTLVVYWQDKRRARRGQWRVPEATLLFFALIGGSPAAWWAQKRFRHKTKKGSFRMRFWGVICLQLAAIAWVCAGMPGLN